MFPSSFPIPLTNKLSILLSFLIIYLGLSKLQIPIKGFSTITFSIKGFITITFSVLMTKKYSKLKLKEVRVNFKSQIFIFIIDWYVYLFVYGPMHAHIDLKCKNYLFYTRVKKFVFSSVFHTPIHHRHPYLLPSGLSIK